jgi:hypothetical protein
LNPEKDPDYMVKLSHELAHWIWGRHYGEAPPLFNEGVAVYAERMSTCDATECDLLSDLYARCFPPPPLGEVIHGEGFWRHKGMYTFSGLWIHFLIRESGWNKLKEFFLRSDFEDQHVVEHFESVYGEQLETVESRWKDYLAEKAP